MSREIAVFGEEPGWHGARLGAAFEAQGLGARALSLRDCAFDLGADGTGLHLPGFGDALPVGAFVRGVPGGTLDEVVFFLDILHALRESGVLVYNDARGIERSVDKAMTSFLLKRAGLPSPPSWIGRDPEQAARFKADGHRRGYDTIVKPLFGSQGEGLVRLGGADPLPDPEQCHGVYYLQRFIDTGEGRWHDWRVFVIGGRAVAVMRREGRCWISNVANGAQCHAARLDDRLRHLAEAAVQAVGLYYAGVDVIRGTDGVHYVVEVNGIPAWKGLQSTCDLDIASLVVADFLSRAGLSGRLEASRR